MNLVHKNLNSPTRSTILNEVSFCIQGQVSTNNLGVNQTRLLIESIHEFYPGAKICFATWENQNLDELSGLGVSIKVLRDPGSEIRCIENLQMNNINRQIISAKASLKMAATKYAVKIRSDMIVTSDKLLDLLPQLPKTIRSQFSWFDHYVYFLDRLTFNPDGTIEIPMHPSDYFQAGHRQDLVNYWSLPLMSKADEKHFLKNPDMTLKFAVGHVPKNRAEAYYWKSFVGQRTGQTIGDLHEKEIDLKIGTRVSFSHNLIPMKSKTLGVDSQKTPWGMELHVSTYAYTFFDWKQDAEKIGVKFPKFAFFTFEYLGQIYRVASVNYRKIKTLVNRIKIVKVKQTN
jgi:hypothetical protein